MEYLRCYFCMLVLLTTLCWESEGGRIVKVGSKEDNFDSESHMFEPLLYVPSINPYNDLDDNGDSISYNGDHNQRDKTQNAPKSPIIFRIVRNRNDDKDQETVSLSCYAYGMPRPEITWWRDDVIVGPDTLNQTRDEVGPAIVKSTVDIVPLGGKNEEHFKCEAKNIAGVDSQSCHVGAGFTLYAYCGVRTA